MENVIFQVWCFGNFLNLFIFRLQFFVTKLFLFTDTVNKNVQEFHEANYSAIDHRGNTMVFPMIG